MMNFTFVVLIVVNILIVGYRSVPVVPQSELSSDSESEIVSLESTTIASQGNNDDDDDDDNDTLSYSSTIPSDQMANEEIKDEIVVNDMPSETLSTSTSTDNDNNNNNNDDANDDNDENQNESTTISS